MNGKRKDLIVGVDIGSSAIHIAVMTTDGEIVFSPKPLMHFADPLGTLAGCWRELKEEIGLEKIRCTSFTGSAAEVLSQARPELLYVYDSVAIPKGVELICPVAKYVFHIGAKDPYFFHLKDASGKKIIQEWRTGTKCGGGSGTLLEKQCRRLFEGQVPNPQLEDIDLANDLQQKEQIIKRNRVKLQIRLEEMFALAQEQAKNSAEPCEFLARCGVVIQSDLIHKQNEGASREDNLAGLFKTIARNFKIDVLGTCAIIDTKKTEAVVTGGVFANDIIRKNLQEFLSIEIQRPQHFRNIAAIGAAAKAIELEGSFVFDDELLEHAAKLGRENRQYAPPLSQSLEMVSDISDQLPGQIAPGTKVVLGIDGGSTTTKGAIVEVETEKLLDKLYIKTHGNPEQSLKNVLKYLSRHKENVVVVGVGATGSARKLYEKILLSKKKTNKLEKEDIEVTDKITDEITCHALGVKHNSPDVDTIFEIGGQDMKFTSFAKDGSVREAKMNYSCQAGSGQTLENMADVINLNVENSLQEQALKAERVPIIDSTCGVFMETDENRLIAEGFSKAEIAAAIIRGTAASYYYKFVGGSQHSGNKCSAQGGPALGKAFLAAMAQVTEKEIYAFAHREMFGAWGQALDVIQNIKQLKEQGKKIGTAFRGWEIIDMEFHKKRVPCRELLGDKTCGVRECQLEVFSIEEDEIITGGFCPKGNSDSSARPKTNYVERYHKIYEKHFKQYGLLLDDLDDGKTIEKPTIGIRRGTTTLGEKGIWSAALLSRLGFCPVVSPKTTKEIAKIGVDNSRTEFCIARKLVTGHAAVLNVHPAIEYLYNPSFIEQRMQEPPNLKYCIYTESEGYVLNDVLSFDKDRQLNPILHFGDVDLIVRAIESELNRLSFKMKKSQIREAVELADRAEEQFRKELHKVGDKFLEKVESQNIKAYIGIGRDYVLLDGEASSNSGVMFSQVRGLDYIPQIFIEHRFKDIALEEVVDNEFWVQSVKILKAGLYVAEHPNLFAIRMMNFACGPDSLKIYQEEKIQQLADKPMLVLLTDAQTNNAPFVTRTEAHERVVNQTKSKKPDISRLRKTNPLDYSDRIWLVPYMGNASYVGAAGLRFLGVDSLVTPTDTAAGAELSAKHIYTEVCYPLRGVVGDMLAFLHERVQEHGKEYVENHYLVMLPTTSGPCRFGKYTELMREFLEREGLQKVPVAGPSSRTDYFDIPLPKKLGFSDKIKVQKILYKGIKATDMLEDITLRFRPYARNRQDVENIKQYCLAQLERIIEQGGRTEDIIEWGRETVSRFERIELKQTERFPLVLYIGEIYMRQHDPYTDFVVHQLEKSGLEVLRDPVTDWIDYVNKVNRRNKKTDLAIAASKMNIESAVKVGGELLKTAIKGRYIASVEGRIAEPFHRVLNGRHVLPKPMEMIERLELENEFHGNIEGESPLSAGIAYHFMNDLVPHSDSTYISGIFHVGPFTCMQEGVATAKIEAMAKELRSKRSDLVFPVIHAFFGESGSTNLDSEIAVFVEQCYQKRELLKNKNKKEYKQKEKKPQKIDIKAVSDSKEADGNLSKV